MNAPFGSPAIPGSSTPGPGGIMAGPQPGQIYVPGIGMVEVKDWTEGPIYDTEQLVTPVGAGQTINFFRNLAFAPPLAAKDVRYTNMTTPSQLPSGWRAVVYGVGFRVLHNENVVGAGVFPTPEDVTRVLTEGVAQFITGNQKVEKEGPLTLFPCPFGISGPIEFAGPALHEVSALSNGTPALGAVPKMSIVIDLTNELTFGAEVTFPGGLILDANVFLQCILMAWISRPVR